MSSGSIEQPDTFVPSIGDIVQHPLAHKTQTLNRCRKCKAITSHHVHDQRPGWRWISCWQCGTVNRVDEVKHA